jgi:integrase
MHIQDAQGDALRLQPINDFAQMPDRARQAVNFRDNQGIAFVAAGIHAPIGNHTFRATGITDYLANGGVLEHAQEMAAHESPRTTKLYDRTKERLTQDEVERI